MERSAILSKCGRYRYTLIRRWTAGALLVVCMLNPSTADGEQNDATIRRLIVFARDAGYAGIFVVNLYAFRATDPRALNAPELADDVVGSENDDTIADAARYAVKHAGGVVAVAWGANVGPIYGRAGHVLELITAAGAVPHAWGLTKIGRPRHPLYMPGSSRLSSFPQPRP